MTKETTKEVRSIDLANDDLVAGLIGTLNEKAQRAWFIKAVRMLETQAISVRGLKATIAKAENSTWMKESHVPYFVKASWVLELDGAKDEPLKKVITTTQDGTRVFKEDFEAKVKASKSFADFVDSIPARESKGRGAGSETASEKAPKLDDLDSLVAFAQKAILEFEGDSLIIRKIEDAEGLVTTLNFFIRNAKAVNHPAGKAQVA